MFFEFDRLHLVQCGWFSFKSEMGATKSISLPSATLGVWIFDFAKAGVAIRCDHAPMRFADGRTFCSIHSNSQIFMNACDSDACRSMLALISNARDTQQVQWTRWFVR